jgi:hypothetical protein
MDLTPCSTAELLKRGVEGRRVALVFLETVTRTARLAPKWIFNIFLKTCS